MSPIRRCVYTLRGGNMGVARNTEREKLIHMTDTHTAEITVPDSPASRFCPPEVQEALAAGCRARLLNARLVEIGTIRVLGGTVTAVRHTAKSVFITNAVGTERVSGRCSVVVF